MQRACSQTRKHDNHRKHSETTPPSSVVKTGYFLLKPGKPTAVNWVAAKGLKLSYHNGYIHIYICIYIYSK